MPDLDIGFAPHPLETIIMWSGLLINIPNGWLLCDGTLGTPDLIKFFARGSPPSTEAGGINGADDHVITQSELPSHDHTTTGLGHRHEQSINSVPSGGIGSTGLGGNTGAGTYDFNDESAGGSFDPEGSNAPHENKPPYFELAFIQRAN